MGGIAKFTLQVTALGCAGLLFAAAPAAAQEFKLNVAGDDRELRSTLRRDALSATVAADDASVPQDLIAAARADYQRLLTALYASGYYGGSISIKIDGREAANLPPLFAPQSIGAVEIDVVPGAAFTFGDVGIGLKAGAGSNPEQLARGEIAGSEAIRTGVQSALTEWRELGHAKARVAQQSIIANHARNTLDVQVQLNPGPRLSFSGLNVQGNRAVRADAIRRIAGLPVNDVYSPQAVKNAAQRLRKTGAFSGVALIEEDEIGPNDTLRFTAQVQEAKPRRIGFGLELSTVSGLTVSSYWMHRNAFGGAENIRIEGEIGSLAGETGGTDYQLGATLKIPAIYGPDTSLTTAFEISREDEPDYLLDKASFEINAVRVLSEALTAEVGLGIHRAREETDDGIDVYTLLTLPVSADYDRRDNPTDTKSGYQAVLDFTPFTGIEGATTGASLNADVTAFRSFGEDDRLTLGFHGQLGSVIAADQDEIPAEFLYYSGGGSTVRGHDYNALGISGPMGDTGGDSFIGVQLEARYNITKSIGVVGFYDYGFVGETSVPGESGAWHSGTGIGVRYQTGIGPIRLDVGTPANGDGAFRSAQIYLGIGQAF